MPQPPRAAQAQTQTNRGGHDPPRRSTHYPRRTINGQGTQIPRARRPSNIFQDLEHLGPSIKPNIPDLKQRYSFANAVAPRQSQHMPNAPGRPAAEESSQSSEEDDCSGARELQHPSNVLRVKAKEGAAVESSSSSEIEESHDLSVEGPDSPGEERDRGQPDVHGEQQPSKVKINQDSAVNFEDTSINQIIHHNRESGKFANIWSTLIFVAHTYNFITTWYFMGLAGFPSGVWLVLELLVEVVVLFDFFLRIYLKHRMPTQWTTMWLLQQREKNSGPVHLLLSFVASLP